jgi:uncharacterized surface protein with fasciclin (FAS1) repeats
MSGGMNFFEISKISKIAAIIVLAAGVGSVVCPPAKAQSATAVLEANPQLGDWQGIVQQAGLASAGSEGTYTVFALTNDGFDKLNAMWRNMLKAQGANRSIDRQRLQRIVRSQVLYGVHPPSDFAGKVTKLISVAGTPIIIDGTSPDSMTATMAYATGHLTGKPTVTDNAVVYPIEVTKVHR